MQERTGKDKKYIEVVNTKNREKCKTCKKAAGDESNSKAG